MQIIFSMLGFSAPPLFLSPFDILFWFYLMVFVLAVVIAFFIPGSIILFRLKLGTFQTVVLGTMLGMALWAWQGFIFGYLNLRFLTYIYLLVCIVIFFKQVSLGYLRFSVKKAIHSSSNIFLAFILSLGTLIQILSVWFMGIKTQEGVIFCCGNLKDQLFHISLSHQIVKQIPPLEPGMSGVIVQNYHYLSNLIVAELSRIFYLPLVATQYQYMTIVISLFLGLTAIAFARCNKLSGRYIFWILFFLYFAGDFIYLFLLLLGKGLSFRMGSLEDGAIFLVNPPRAFAVVMFFAATAFLSIWVRRKIFFIGVLLAIMVSTLIGLKVYLGLFALVGLAAIGVYYLLKKELKMLPPLVLAVIGSLVFYLPVNTAAGGLYFTSFWIFENFVSQPQFELIRLELARTIYAEHKNYLRLIQYELMYVAIYFFSIFGIKVVGFFQTKKSLSQLPLPIHLFLVSGLLMSAIAGFFFQQTSGGSNSFNFIVSIFIISSIYAALAVEYWLNKIPKKLAIILGIIMVVITVARVGNQTYENIRNITQGNGYFVTNSQLELMRIARELSPSSIFYIDPTFVDTDKQTPFVSYLIDKPVYLSGEEILVDHNVPTKKRVDTLLTIFRSNDSVLAARLLKESDIEYIITNNPVAFSADQVGYFVKEMYRNKSGRILHINRADTEKFLKTPPVNGLEYEKNPI